jgi:hypothetical protein
LNRYIILMLLFLLLSSCVYQKKSAMDELFSMKIGYSENELGLLSKDEVINSDTMNIYYKHGFYYISDAVNNKILKTTEKGEPVLVIFNKDYNPTIKPTVVEKDTTSDHENLVYVKLYKDYPVYSPGLITSDINKNIYFINRLPSYRIANDDGTIYEQMVLKFDSKGDFVYEIGQNGVSSTPFGFIMSINIDEKNNLIVQENNDKGILIYKFAEDGTLLKKAQIEKEKIPVQDKEKTFLFDIVDTKIGYFENDIYLTVQFIKETQEPLSVTKYETMYEKIFKFSLDTMNFDPRPLMRVNTQYVDISKHSSNASEIKELYGDKQKIMRPIETLIGIDDMHNLYFSQKDVILSKSDINNESLHIYNSFGGLLKNVSVKYPQGVKFASDMFFSSNGKIFSYYVKEGEIHFVLIN